MISPKDDPQRYTAIFPLLYKFAMFADAEGQDQIVAVEASTVGGKFANRCPRSSELASDKLY
jgi:hypothetical protein